MSSLSPKERLQRVLQKKEIDRAPVICPGGMMNAAIVDVMNKTAHTLPEAHHDDALMSELAHDVYEQTGFENFGIPFCMTVEAEVLGSEINFGTLACEPKIEKEIFSSASKVDFKNKTELANSGRVNTIIQAGYRLSKQYPDIPVIGNLTGPISTAASIVDPITFLKELLKDKANSHQVLDYVSDFLLEYAKLMIDNGVTIITIADPTATGEILGPRMFEEYAVTYLNKIITGIHSYGAPVIVHICGNMNRVKHLIPRINSDAISTDALVNLRLLKEEYPQLTTMGNLSTYLLEFGKPEDVGKRATGLVQEKVDIISPACGLSTSTSLANISAMTTAVKECGK
ncbi:MAG TPA: uroporphyrinogen decarboxylase family protein [Desulfosporosinus sp.]|nr:uroporphyrinogen decarboxylase family protein [Desulfosporosinus sp.]